MKHNIRLFSVLIISLAGLALGQTVYASDVMNSPSVTVVKRETASSSTVTQTTTPLAGAHYRLTRVLPINGKEIVPTDSATYLLPSNDLALSVELITDADGRAIYGDTEALAEGYYLLAEQSGDGVEKPADPIVFKLPYTDATGKVTDDFTYEPKSGLVETDTDDPVKITSGNATPSQSGSSTIMQTSGEVWQVSLTKTLFSTTILLSSIIGGTVLVRKRWEEKKYE
ncbi:prealbumin-like fold domain-containing protein [Enterococcus xiangfangensis]|uniref:prealbumin-like fold domain-containing protein n=1 Tax=Enterococcus xiangfangensis TaxID=1296537 RepID=UPI0010F4EA82|nr:prealbumin-like fold domain-containing protein [Enterococcus xiangfangensis]MBM7712199.1 hypothetical protein [Enterococcus xiangfangensis]